MSRKFIYIAGAVAVGISSVTLPAAADQIDRRQYNQMRRIDQGVMSGELTRREARHLWQQQAYINSLERRAKRDGHLTGWERARLRYAQNYASRSIYSQKHDRQKRWYWW